MGRGSGAKQFTASHLRGLAPAGRLDIDSTGLIVFTQDGRVAKRLIGRDSEVEKEYLVRVEGTLLGPGHEAAPARPRARRREAQAGEGRMAERGSAALRAARGPQAADPPHVRAGRADRDRAEARAQRRRAAGRRCRSASGATCAATRSSACRTSRRGTIGAAPRRPDQEAIAMRSGMRRRPCAGMKPTRSDRGWLCCNAAGARVDGS